MNPPRHRHAATISSTGSLLLALTFLAATPHAAAQAPTSTAPPPQSQPSGQPTAKESTKPAQPPKAKKVITNEDLEGPSKGTSGDKIVTGDSASLLSCESSCEQEARARLGYDSDREGEWQMQAANARRDLVADTEWRGLLSQTIQQTRTYCNLLAQESRKNAPSNNSYDARVQRAKNQQYFQNMERTLQQGLESLANRSQTKVQEVEALSAVRAAMMQVQLSHIAERDCDLPR